MEQPSRRDIEELQNLKRGNVTLSTDVAHMPIMSPHHVRSTSNASSKLNLIINNNNEDKGDKTEEDDEEGKNSKKRRKTVKSSSEITDARRESHKIIEQKRRQKINEKINELREILNCPEGSQNKAVILQSAVESIRNLKVVCNKIIQHHRQLQEDYVHLLHENERLRKAMPSHVSRSIPPHAPQVSPYAKDMMLYDELGQIQTLPVLNSRPGYGNYPTNPQSSGGQQAIQMVNIPPNAPNGPSNPANPGSNSTMMYASHPNSQNSGNMVGYNPHSEYQNYPNHTQASGPTHGSHVRAMPENSSGSEQTGQNVVPENGTQSEYHVVSYNR